MSLRSRDDVAAWKAILDADLRVGPPGGCPPASLLLASARGEAARGEDEAVLDHAASCGACSAAWRIGREMHLSEGKLAEIRAPRSRAVWWAAAAAAVILVALVPAILRKAPGTAPVLRAPREIAITALSDPSLPRDAFLLRWGGVPEGSRFDLRITTADLDPILVASGLERAELEVPAQRLESVEPGDGVMWRVTARLPDGRTAESVTFTTLVQ